MNKQTNVTLPTTPKFFTANHKIRDKDRYVIQNTIGRGAYGVVSKAWDKKKEEHVAIKKITHVLKNVLESKRYCREIRLLRQLNHENILSIKNILVPNNLSELYIVTELLDTDLHQLIVSRQPLSEQHVQYFVFQICKAVVYLHSNGVIHRDLKPSNILVNQDCQVKLGDFGLAKGTDSDLDHVGFMTEYVATRWYRAPEIMISWKSYTETVDVWSIGCIFAELCQRRPLFPGKDYLHQMKLVLDVIGEPNSAEFKNVHSQSSLSSLRNHLKNLSIHHNSRPKGTPRMNNKHYYQQRHSFERIDKLRKLVPNVTNLGFNLLQDMLKYPSERIKSTALLHHQFFATLREPSDLIQPKKKKLKDDVSFGGSFQIGDVIRVFNEEAIYWNAVNNRNLSRTKKKLKETTKKLKILKDKETSDEESTTENEEDTEKDK